MSSGNPTLLSQILPTGNGSGGTTLPTPYVAGEFLTNNGTTLSWAAITSGNNNGFPIADMGLITDSVATGYTVDAGSIAS
jgi:hypothetical protein